MVKDYIIALSLANIVFLRTWVNLFYIDEKYTYFMQDFPGITSYLAIILNVVCLSVVLFFIIRLTKRFYNNVFINSGALLLILLLIMLPLYFLGEQYIKNILTSLIMNFGETRSLVFIVSIGMVIALYMFYRYKLVLQILLIIALVTSPFVIVTFGQTVWALAHIDKKDSYLIRTSNQLGHKSSPRVVWLIFDEMDARLSFFERPSTVRMPEFDQLSKESVSAVHAFPPNGETLLSLPSLLTGKLVAEAKNIGYDELLIRFDDAEANVDWKLQSNVFSIAENMGINSAVVGWYHPYSRIVGNHVGYSSWYQGGIYSDIVVRDTIYENMCEQIKILVPFISREQHIEAYQNVLNDAKRIVTSNNFQFIFVHIPVPHAPFIYDQDKESFTMMADPIKGYLAQLNLADKTLGELRSGMEEAGVWENTTLIISSDHWWRKSEKFDGKIDHRVPFIVRMSGQNQGITYGQPFNTVLTHDLVLAILKGECVSNQGVVNWLDAHRTIGESPYYNKDTGEYD